MTVVRSDLLHTRGLRLLLFVSGGLIVPPADDEHDHRRAAADSDPTIRARSKNGTPDD